MIRLRHICFGATILALLIGCSKTQEQEIAVESVSLNQPTAELIIGETVQLKATVLPSNASEKTVTWTSTKQSVATVSANGTVTAIAEGQSTITANASGKSASCIVTVSKGFVEVTSITLNKESIALVKGESESLVATVKPDDATDKKVVWGSSNNAVATVDDSGKVIAAGGGSAIITAKSGNQQASCNITVTVPVESVSLDRESITLEEESELTLVATVKPDDATNKAVTWTSSNAQIASVDDNGKVLAIKEGSATITAKAGDKQATCAVTVNKKIIAVESITLNKTESALNKGQSETLIATVKPDNATDKTVSWTSSNTAVATVDSEGKVTAVASGNAIISAKAGDKEATCAITVTVPLESITLNKTELALNKGQSETLVATIKPDDATESTITWSSSNTGVAHVDSNGKVTAVGGGNATITAKVGNLQATCTVTVTVPVESISLDRTAVTLIKGESITLTATVYPSDATDKNVSWTSSNEGIVSVSNNGLVSSKGVGEATVNAIAGGKEATCSVSVNEPDHTPPVVESFTFSPESVDVTDGPKDVKLSFHVTDETGVNEASLPRVYIYYEKNNNGTLQSGYPTRESGTNKDGVYTITFTIPQGATPGEWTLNSQPFVDLYGNQSTTLYHYPNGGKSKLTVISN